MRNEERETMQENGNNKENHLLHCEYWYVGILFSDGYTPLIVSGTDGARFL